MPQVRKMTSFNPHIFRAFYEWLIENEITPHLVVNADKPGVEVPREFVQRHMIVLSISPLATRDFEINQSGISFSARFHGVEQYVAVPFAAMQEIFAVETSISYPISLWLTEDQGVGEDYPAEDSAPAPAEEPGAQFAPLEAKDDKQGAESEDSLPSFTVLPPSKD